jgi:NAD(P)-dependent dehydrogenase (short-subunit alcohol dehydrogenase family)
VSESTPRNGELALAGQTVVVIGGISGVGLASARRARAEGAGVIITGDDPDRLQRVGLELGASIAVVDANDTGRLERFFSELPQVDHVLVTGAGRLSEAYVGDVARVAAPKIRPGGTLIFASESPAPELEHVQVYCIATESPAEDVAAQAVDLMADAALAGA